MRLELLNKSLYKFLIYYCYTWSDSAIIYERHLCCAMNPNKAHLHPRSPALWNHPFTIRLGLERRPICERAHRPLPIFTIHLCDRRQRQAPVLSIFTPKCRGRPGIHTEINYGYTSKFILRGASLLITLEPWLRQVWRTGVGDYDCNGGRSDWRPAAIGARVDVAGIMDLPAGTALTRQARGIPVNGDGSSEGAWAGDEATRALSCAAVLVAGYGGLVGNTEIGRGAA